MCLYWVSQDIMDNMITLFLKNIYKEIQKKTGVLALQHAQRQDKCHNFTQVAGPSTFISALQDGLKCHIRRDGIHLTSQIIRSPWIPITALNNVFLQDYKYLLMW